MSARVQERDPLATPDLHLTAGAYALGVLDGCDVPSFERHLTGCERCRLALSELGGAVSALARLRPPGCRRRPAAEVRPGTGRLRD